ncbi:type II toxin-antitoxin system prevent-host-death family antitoxin [Algiphilus sp.]|uniref:type II toxin-antitoxin system Phd/YefM family antitoxin n=1 Tax=Algiphilus sp. TaxID=1872431 RepID=UPI0025B81380|nr:type II toxin-antitoxin system prevent-host-death family antitoxin [Abyssibacter sp.]MCK5857876.1 type II toxin-antitoxin system prevent-host-death family antitoxin [Abyssibacter sp.]
MDTISASEANRRFSALLRAVQQGDSVTILSRGRAVAVVEPVSATARRGREGAREALLGRLQRQPVTGRRDWTRDELYD